MSSVFRAVDELGPGTWVAWRPPKHAGAISPRFWRISLSWQAKRGTTRLAKPPVRRVPGLLLLSKHSSPGVRLGRQLRV